MNPVKKPVNEIGYTGFICEKRIPTRPIKQSHSGGMPPREKPPIQESIISSNRPSVLEFFPKKGRFDKILQNKLVQNGQLRRNDKKTTGRQGIALTDSCGIPRH
ncbi:hypothetical protein ADIS_1512 [Lunatimonas lonarensis]|uniref:Uncharacterized protein n=1 Tax=Lunatimonas lonarensis TaxID=1232681 RepID=R7ZVB5_9BACT|nr:hypothetical protein ADIS_1512 [Lunatimonas lonarensis]